VFWSPLEVAHMLPLVLEQFLRLCGRLIHFLGDICRTELAIHLSLPLTDINAKPRVKTSPTYPTC
jgi:hypothetical protein